MNRIIYNIYKLYENFGRVFFVYITKKRRRGKMMVHPNSQVKGPELDSTLERLIYHRRGNFLNHFYTINSGQKFFTKDVLGKISQVYRQSPIRNIGFCLFLLLILNISVFI